MKIILIKHAGILLPGDLTTEEWIAKLKPGQSIHADFKRMRGYLFHKKYFSLLNFAFSHIEYGDIEYEGVKVEPNFDRFREDLTIMAGYYKPVFSLSGEVTPRAKSISFANMQQDEFERLYNASINVILKHVLKHYDREALDGAVNQLMSYA